MVEPSSVQARKDQSRAFSDDRLELFRATLRELEETEGTRPNHPGITHLKWLISIAVRESAPPADSNAPSFPSASLIEKG